jgi:hypothetical protein
MARHHLNDPRVRAVVDQLTNLTLEVGSINAVAALLSGESEDTRIYPNRLHGLLAGDPTRSVNTATLESMERRLAAVDASLRESPAGAAERARVMQTVAVEVGAGGGSDDCIGRAAERLNLPLGLVRHVVGADQGISQPETSGQQPERKPDWSWQDVAIQKSLRALRKSPRYKAGLVVPTGGGKTRIALSVALRWLSDRMEADDVVLWVTHRHHLKIQARRTLQQLLSDNASVPDGSAELFSERIKFVMVQDLENAVIAHAAKTGLVIVDEAHHAAAPSYGPIFDSISAPALLLTATPNRRDALPIGIDEICYTITYRELFERGCVVEPTFEPPLDLPGLNWSEPEGLNDLADYLLDRAESDFKKTLVVVPLQSRAEALHKSLSELLATQPNHILTPDNVGFVHGSGTSGVGSPTDFLDEFAAWPRGILVATSQLIGEGFDDPGIDAVVVTYPSTSIGHLMQVAGRALRTNAGKDSAHIVQVRESPLEYHFEQRWLYQDISDALRPALIDLTYGSAEELRAEINRLISTYRIAPAVANRIAAELAAVVSGETVNLMLTGLPHWGSRDTFDQEARWGGLLITATNRNTFRSIFNEISAQTDDLKEYELFLRDWIRREVTNGSTWKSYVDLIQAMEYARREIFAIEYAGADQRPYSKPVGTTWLRYVTLTYSPSIPAELAAFVADAVNRTEIFTLFESQRTQWDCAVKIELPLTGSVAYLLGPEQALWFENTRQRLLEALGRLNPVSSMDALESMCRDLSASPIPVRLVTEFRQFMRADRFDRQVLRLRERLK